MTNTGKFKIIPLAVRKIHPIRVDGNLIPYSSESSLLGLHFNSVGITKHVTHDKNKVCAAVTTIKRFTGLPTNIK